GAPLPAPLAIGTGEPDPASAWWRLRALGDSVMRDPQARTPPVQRAWGAWEAALLEAVARDRRAAADGHAARADELLRRQMRLLDELERN
ncbi:MAG: hypothetical protein HY359_09850, partial [Candidatus Rokubacteria bacterium]|nr:hypothetical protein [Candidatus Rokubacteria bacterium]